MKNEDLCCCCLINCCFKDINEVYFHNGKLESYGEMLSNTFNVSLKRKSICEGCIVKLREAAAFKQQILAADLTLIVQSQQLADDDDEQEYEVKFEPEETNKALPQDDKLENYDDAFMATTTCMDSADDKGCSENNSAAIEIEVTVNKERRKKCKKKSQRVSKDKKGPTTNTMQLISNSNICVFKPFQSNTEFACYVCKETYTDIKDVREHSKTHKKSDFLKKISVLRGVTSRHADISNLSCICAHACEDLDALTTHLTEKHGVQFENGGHLLIPYKLEDGLQCVVCKKEFITFYSLTSHMNSHSTVNVCDICGAAYYSRHYLRAHVRTKHRVNSCRICPSQFPTATALAMHNRKIHKKISKRVFQCNECNLTFKYGYKLKDHMISSHGMPDIKAKCGICGKVLKNKTCLTVHKRSVHEKERRYQCTQCDLRFFTNFDKVRHEKTHLSKIWVSCDYCETTFMRKDSLRRHMKKKHTVAI